jgi:tetratricopeptide (TPR) repeat protein
MSASTPRRWAESAAAVALLAVPLYFTVFTSRVFEGDKAALARWLGLGALIALASAAWGERRRGGRGAHPTTDQVDPSSALPDPTPSLDTDDTPVPWPRRLAWALALCLAVELAATVLSVAPWTSLLGSRTRGQGLATTLAIAALAWGAASMAARPGGELRLAGFLGLSALPAGLYALAQSQGLDPLPWEGDVVTRVVGPAGASPMLAAHLVLALPFAALRATDAWGAARREPGWPAAGKLAAWLVTVGAGGAALLLSASRGPLLGLAAGLWLVGLTAAARIQPARRRRAVALGLVATAFLGAAFFVALNRGAFPNLARLPLLDRLSTALDPQRNSTRARMRLWEGSMLALGDLAGRPDSDPPTRDLPPRWRALVGYGPETMDLSWAPVYPPLLAYDEPRGYMPDRAHSLLLDAALTGGLLGAAAQLVLLVTGIAAAWSLAAGTRPPSPRPPPLEVSGEGAEARGPGITRTSTRRFPASDVRVSWTTTLALGLLSLLVLRLDGSWCLARSPWPAGACLIAPALGLGLIAGFGLGLTILAWRGAVGDPDRADGVVDEASDRVREDPWRFGGFGGLEGPGAFGAAALVALAAHALELQVSFATVASRLSAWTIIGGLIGIGLRRGRSAPIQGGASSPLATVRARESDDALLASGTIGLTLAFSLARPGQVAGGPVTAAALIALGAGGAWLALRPARLARPGQAGRLALAVALYTVLQVLLLDWLAGGPSDAVPAAAASMAIYVLSLAILAACLDRDRRSANPSDSSSGSTTGRLAVILPVALLVAIPCLAPTVADAWFKEGERGWQVPVSALRSDGKGGKAESYLQRALDRYGLARWLAPWEPAYALAEARAYVEYADLLDARLRLALGQAPAPADPAQPADPADPAAGRWQAARDRQMTLALAAIDRAEALAPGSPTPPYTRARALRVWGLSTQQPAERARRLDLALASYATAAARVPGWPEILDEAAQTALAADRPREALDLALEVVLQRDAFFRRAWRTAALAHEALGDPARASAAYAAYFVDWRNASDLTALRGWVRALSAAGHTRSALERARRAVQLAPGDAGTHADLATLLETTGDLAEARRSAATALAISPEDAGIRALVERLDPGDG